MPAPTNRPVTMGYNGVVTSGHYLASAAGMDILRQGGNAVDAAVAAGLVLSVVEQGETSPGGEAPMLVYSARERRTFAISGVGWSPKAFTIDWCRENGVDMIPGDGYLPACVPSQIGTWTLALERFGTMSFGRVAKSAIDLAENGFPVYDALQRKIADNRERFLQLYPTTAEVYLPGGKVPAIGDRLRNPDLAWMLKHLADAEQNHKKREAGLSAVRDVFYRGEIAERIVRFIADNPVKDATGKTHAGLLTYDDFADWHPTVEEPLALEYRGLTVHKCSSWTQGPVFLQQLAILRDFDLTGMGFGTPDHIHTWAESAKLAFADREAYYGDPRFDDPPFDQLLSVEYNTQRRGLIGPDASLDLRPGHAGNGVPDCLLGDVLADNRRALGIESPTDATPHADDTSHLDVIDAEGNMVAVTPSGGWISSSPVIPGVGFPLGTRGQMFYLNSSRPNALEPRKRPRATLTPTLVTRDNEPLMAFGMRGGDIQDQVTLHFLLNHIDFGMDVQEALDAPAFWSDHFPSSFYPRTARPGVLNIDSRVDGETLQELRRRGHEVNPVDSPGHNTMGIVRDPVTRTIRGGVCSRGEHAYAIGW
jgi:gamma-glutamyltranspeptidase / glutathione hydrolase